MWMSGIGAVPPRICIKLRPMLLTLLLWLAALVPAFAVEPVPDPLQPIDTSSPRATFLAFRDNLEQAYQRWRLREGGTGTLTPATRALRTLDLRGVGEALLVEVGLGEALYLLETLNRIDLPPLTEVPDAAMVKAQGLTRWTIPGTEITIAQVADGERAGEFLFTSDTVSRARQFYELVKHLPVQRGAHDVLGTWRAAPGLLMPNALAAKVWDLHPWAFHLVMEQPVWKWVAACLGVLATTAFLWLAWRAGRSWDRRCVATGAGWRIGEPLTALGASAALAGLGIFLERVVLFGGRPGVAASVAITILHYAVLAWLVAILVSGVGRAAVRAFTSSAGSLDAALIRLCFRVLSIAGALAVVLHAASELGLSITPIIAGLGVGGLAVALAIRPTLENIVGGFVLFADKPVRVGEFCSFGDKLGTVEEIGLRSTRIRGLDRTLITVPNAEFAQMQIVNFTRRDMNLYQCSVGLRYETTPDQLRYIAAKIRKLLIRHAKVSPDPARVRLNEFGASAFVLEVFAFVRCADWNEFLAVKEDLNLRIAEIVRDSGTSFAFPSQTVYFTRDPGVDAARGAETEVEVQKWREENRLPFPEFDFAERAEMADTIAFPPPGSPDHRPSPPTGADARPADRGQVRKQGWPALLRRRREAATAEPTVAGS
jgi:MscS family membrane protein